MAYELNSIILAKSFPATCNEGLIVMLISVKNLAVMAQAAPLALLLTARSKGFAINLLESGVAVNDRRRGSMQKTRSIFHDGERAVQVRAGA